MTARDHARFSSSLATASLLSIETQLSLLKIEIDLRGGRSLADFDDSHSKDIARVQIHVQSLLGGSLLRCIPTSTTRVAHKVQCWRIGA